LTEYSYDVTGSPPFTTARVSVIVAAPGVVEVTRMEGALGVLSVATEPSTKACVLFEESV
jgi:hypothetical protein